jgi:hypothetical protein
MIQIYDGSSAGRGKAMFLEADSDYFKVTTTTGSKEVSYSPSLATGWRGITGRNYGELQDRIRIVKFD